MEHIDAVRDILADILGLGQRKHLLNADSALLGSIPELDSMAVLSVLTGLEEHFGFTLEDDDISAGMFDTLGSLAQFVEAKLAE